MIRMMTGMPMMLGLMSVLAMGPLGCERDADVQRVTIGQRAFTLELALDEASRTTGLMHRESIDEDGGMLFVFPDMQRRAFWMKHCLTDIDAIFLDGRGNVVAVHAMKAPDPATPEAQLPRYPSGRAAQFVIELRGGEADKVGVKVGDRIALPLESLKRRAR